jgi:hypothetical protein
MVRDQFLTPKGAQKLTDLPMEEAAGLMETTRRTILEREGQAAF